MTDTHQPGPPGTAGIGLPPLGLTWGVKRSFVSYLSHLPDASVSAAGGADIVNGSFFNFAPAGGDYDPATGLGTLRFSGDVRLSGHGGMMRIQLRDPWVSVTEGGMEFGTTLEGPGGLGGDQPCTLARLSGQSPQRTEGRLLWLDVATLLTADGSGIFNDQYPKGQEMDPLFIHLADPLPA